VKKFPFATAFGFAGAGLFATLFAGAAAATETPSPTALTLINGWTNAPFSTSPAAAETLSNTVHLKGAIATSGTNPVPFVLPTSFRPATDVYVPVDLCGATNGRLFISHSGTVTVQAETSFANAQCFTSLDSVTYAKNTSGYTNLTLINGWTGAGFSTSAPAVRLISGIVRLKGSIETSGTNTEPFVLPVGVRPSTNVYVPVDLCNAAKGRLIIQPTGDVTVQAENNFSDAQCFTSLDGASFGLAAFKPLKLKHGWLNSPYGTAVPAVKTIAGAVHFQGAMVTAGTNTLPFVLPAAYRPTTNVYIPVDMCNATNGRLNISPNGVVSVQAETAFSNAQCFTSLEGASFVK
ncbi:MAG: hypothetical protein WDN04_26805, partial [Rhodospirillales bacterium]